MTSRPHRLQRRRSAARALASGLSSTTPGTPRGAFPRRRRLVTAILVPLCLVASAAAEPNALAPTTEMQFLFERTASRLYEMRSAGYLTGRLDRHAAAASA